MVVPFSPGSDGFPSFEERQFLSRCLATLDYAEDGSPNGYLDPQAVRREHLGVLAGLGREDAPEPLDLFPALAALSGIDPETLNDSQALDYMAASGKMASWMLARQYKGGARFATFRPPVPSEADAAVWRTHPDISKWAPAEVGAALHDTRYRGEQLIYEGQDLVEHLPNVLAALEAGTLDNTRVQAILRGLNGLPREHWAAAEADILARAASLTAQGLYRRARRTAEKLNPEPLTVRHQHARKERNVTFHPRPDGMAELTALLPAVQARRYYETIDAWAEHARNEGQASTATTPGGKPSRAINEYRADALIDLFEAALNPDNDDAGTDDEAGAGTTDDEADAGTDDDATGAGATDNNEAALTTDYGTDDATDAGTTDNGTDVTDDDVTDDDEGPSVEVPEEMYDDIVADAEAAAADAADDAAAGEGGTAAELTVYGDAAYGTGVFQSRLEGAGIASGCKTQPPCSPGGRYAKDRFAIDIDAGTESCPNDVLVSIRRSADGGGTASFAGACAACPLRGDCTNSPNGRTISIGPHEAALARARATQADPAWKADYRATRPKVERKLGHLMHRKHGGRRARVRGTRKIDADFNLLAAAVNLARLGVLGLRSTTAGGWASAA